MRLNNRSDTAVRSPRRHLPAAFPRVVLSDAARFAEKLGLQPLLDLHVETVHVDQSDHPSVDTHFPRLRFQQVL